LSSTGFVSQVGNTILALLWLPITIADYRMDRQRRFAQHREWMPRSFALTTSIVVNRLWLVLLITVLSPKRNDLRGDCRSDDHCRGQRASGITPDEMPGGHLVALSRPKDLADRLEAYWANQTPT
jgi:hypothetical protein